MIHQPHRAEPHAEVTSEVIRIVYAEPCITDRHEVKINIRGASLLSVAWLISRIGDVFPELPLGIERVPTGGLRHIVKVDVPGEARLAYRVRADIDKLIAEVF